MTEREACMARHPAGKREVYGRCTACGAVEVLLRRPSGTQDLSQIGEHAAYPVGYGCEVCD